MTGIETTILSSADAVKHAGKVAVPVTASELPRTINTYIERR
jgi:hypothetical protein